LADASFPQRSKSARTVSYPSKQVPFDISLEKLPPGFAGNDIIAITEALFKRWSAQTKDEFETTAAYQQRISKLNATPYLDQLVPSSLLAFVLPEEALQTAYNADTQMMAFTVRLPIDKRPLCEREKAMKCRALVLTTPLVSQSSFIGQNAFGAKFKADKFHAVSYGMNFLESATLPIQDPWEYAYRMHMSVPAASARMVKPALRAVVIGHLTNMNLSLDAAAKTATIHEPVETNVLHFRLHFAIKEIWFFNTVTGEVLAKLNKAAIDAAEAKRP
jgi:hypothetical protein